MRRLIAALLALTCVASAHGALAAGVRAPHATAELAAQTAGVAPGSTVWVVVALTADRGWHTYWRNPGDAGEATKIAWTLPRGWRAGDIVWPAPRRLPVGPIMNYGYEGRALLTVPIEVPASAAPGARPPIAARVDYLVCADVCVPGAAALTLALPVVAGAPAADPIWGRTIDAALAAAPKPQGLTAHFRASPGRLVLAVAGAPLAGRSPADVYFYPYDDRLIDHGKPEAVERGPRGLTLTMTPGQAFAGGGAPAQASGVLAVDGKVFEITATPGAGPAGAAGLGPLARAPPESLGLALAAGYALLGGLLLNLMPCVFPILAMKAAALAGHGGAARAQGLAFMAGVLAAFLALAGILIAARAAGAAIGWGFQLQSPVVVAALALVMLAAALNLSGLYEIGTSLQGLGAGAAARGETLGSLLTGALAVVVAAPCTAPFMGPALGYALTQPPGPALAVFVGLAAGFALPFTLIAFSPGLMRRLPRPGPWMDGARKALAFPMYAAAAWLTWVLAQQTDPAGLARLLAAAVVLALAAWLFGAAQHRRAQGRPGPTLAVLAAASLGLSLTAVAAGRYAPPAARTADPAAATAGALASDPYTPQRLAALRAAGRPVLVNFTAAWCVTCQVNQRAVFASAEVARAMKRTDAAYLVADWTNRDAVIAKALADQGRIGVPLYLVYAPGAQSPKALPPLLTSAMVAEALDEAAAKPPTGA